MAIFLSHLGWRREIAQPPTTIRVDAERMSQLLRGTVEALNMEWDDYEASFDRFHDHLMEIVDDASFLSRTLACDFDPEVEEEADYVDYLFAMVHLSEEAHNVGHSFVLQLPDSAHRFAEQLNAMREQSGFPAFKS